MDLGRGSVRRFERQQVLRGVDVDRVVRVPMPSAAIDVDTPEDLLALEAPH